MSKSIVRQQHFQGPPNSPSAIVRDYIRFDDYIPNASVRPTAKIWGMDSNEGQRCWWRLMGPLRCVPTIKWERT